MYAFTLNYLFILFISFHYFQQSPGKNAKFEPLYNWTYTLFRCTNKTDFANGVGMYLGSDNNKSLATLVQVNEDSFHPALYPDPRTLFIKTTD